MVRNDKNGGLSLSGRHRYELLSLLMQSRRVSESCAVAAGMENWSFLAVESLFIRILVLYFFQKNIFVVSVRNLY